MRTASEAGRRPAPVAAGRRGPLTRPAPLARALRPLFLLALLVAGPCLALDPEFVDKAANILAYVIIVAVPVGGIALFWVVHVLPEKIAEKRHHPQKDAIHVLCLLSLVFGGLLWPLAWLWTYTKPVLHKAAYGRDKHDDYYKELDDADKAGVSGDSVIEEASRLRRELDALAERGELPPAMQALRKQLKELRPAKPAEDAVGENA